MVSGVKYEKISINFTLIKNHLKDNNLTIKYFCKLCNIKYYNYRQLMLGDGNIKGEVLFKIGKITNIKLKDLIEF